MHSFSVARSVDFTQSYNHLKKLYSDAKGFSVRPEDVELNGVKIFAKLSDREKWTVGNSLPEHKRHAEVILSTAHGIAEQLGCKTSDDLMSVIQILSKEVSGDS